MSLGDYEPEVCPNPVPRPAMRLQHHGNFIRLVGERAHRLRRRNWNGGHDPLRAVGPRDRDGGSGRPAGSESVVDDDDGPPLERDHRVIAPEAHRPTGDLGCLSCFDGGQLVVGDPGCVHDPLVEHAQPVLADRPHAELGLEGYAELADHDHVERRTERGGDLKNSPQQARYPCRSSAPPEPSPQLPGYRTRPAHATEPQELPPTRQVGCWPTTFTAS